MAGPDAYGLLRSAIQIANDVSLAYPARLHALAVLMAEAANAASATIYLIAPDRQQLQLKLASTDIAHLQACAIPVGAGIAGVCARDRAVISASGDRRHPDETAADAITALPAGNGGVIALATAIPLPPATLTVIGDIATAVDGVIQRLGLSEASRRRVRALTALGEIGQALNRPLLPRKLIPLLLRTIQRHTGICCVLLRIPDDSSLPRGVFTVTHRRKRGCAADVGRLEAQAAPRVLAAGQTVALPASPGDDSSPPLLCVPLRLDTGIIGVLTFAGPQDDDGNPRPFDREDRELCEQIATLASASLAGAASFQESARLTTANDRRLRELSLLYRLNNTMLGTVSVDKLIHLTLTALTCGSSAIFERAMLFMTNERNGTLRGMLGIVRDESDTDMTPVRDQDDPLASHWEISDEAMVRQTATEFSRRVRETRLPLDCRRNVTSRAILDRKLVHVPDTSREERVDRDFVKRFGISAFAVAPLVARDHVVGVVLVDNPLHRRPIGRDDLRVLKLMATQAGKAIENAMLYSEIEATGRTLDEAQERIIQSERLAAIGEMAAGIAHELKGPLVSIGGFARRLEKKLPPANEEHDAAAIIVREVQRLESMLSDILSFSRKTSICYEPCHIPAIVTEALELTREQTARTGVTTVWQPPADIPPVLGDGQQLKQVFLNLFQNAVEAMSQGGTLRVTVEADQLDTAPAVAVIVSDTGGGIPLTMLHNIFSPFFTTKRSGTGLGLPIVHKIVTQHGGRINAANQASGAEFRVVLPERP